MIQPLMIMNLVASASGTSNYLKVNIPSVCVLYNFATGFCNSSLYFFFLKTASQLLTKPGGKSGVVLALRKTNTRRFCLQRRTIDELFYKEESIVFVASFHAISIITTNRRVLLPYIYI